MNNLAVHDEEADLQLSADRQIFSSSIGSFVLSIGVFGVLSAVAGIMPAVAIGGAMFWMSIKGARSKGKSAAFITKTGNFAHALNEEDLLKLIRLEGEDAVLNKLNAALHAGIKLSSAAEDLLEARGMRFDRPTIADYVAGTIDVKAVAVQPAPIAVPIPAIPCPDPGGTVEPIEVIQVHVPQPQHSAVIETVHSFERLQPKTSTAPSRAFNPLDLARSEYIRPLLLVGPSRSGKTLLAHQAGEELRRVYGDRLSACYITPVRRADRFSDESHLFSWCDKVIRLPLMEETDPCVITDAYKQFDRALVGFIRQISDQEHPKLFIADELSLLYLASKTENEMAKRFWGRLSNSIVAYASGGQAVGIAVWGMSPLGSVAHMGLERGAMSPLTPVYVSRFSDDGWNGNVFKGARTNNLTPDREPSTQLKDYCIDNELTRVISVGCKEWQPLANYTPRTAVQDADRNRADAPAAIESETIAAELLLLEEKIHQIAIKSGGLSARDVCRKKLKVLSKMSYSEAVRHVKKVFHSLEQQGRGRVSSGQYQALDASLDS